jgi:2-dehydropantoate 2-reductase
MKICIVGCGAIGGHLAVKFALAGAQVSAIIREGPALQAVRDNGVTLKNSQNAEWSLPIRAETGPQELGPQDLVVVAVKTPALAAISRILPPLLGQKTSVVFMLNGIPWWLLSRLGGSTAPWSPNVAKTISALSAVVGHERIIGGIAHSANQVIAPGVVYNSTPNGSFCFGEPDNALSDRVVQLAKLVDHHGGVGVATTSFVDDMWMKLFTNVVSGPLGGLTGAGTASIIEDEKLAPIVERMSAEMIAVATACGSKNAPSEYRFVRGTGKHKSSMLQDFEALRRPELDSLLGSLIDLAYLLHVPVPSLEIVFAIVRKRAEILGIYG